MNFFTTSETIKVVLPALIGAGSAILVFVIKDIILFEIREKRTQKQQLLDRRLSQLYGPIFVAMKGGKGMLGNIFVGDDKIFEKFITNMHLLSPELYDIAQQYVRLGRDVRSSSLPLSETEIALKLSNEFNEFYCKKY